MNVKYLREVTHPANLAGQVDEEKEIPDDDANRLASEGYVKILAGDQKDEKEHGGTDSGSN